MKYPILSTLIVFPCLLFAQVTSKLSSAVVAYENQEFEQAIYQLDEVLEKPDQIAAAEQAKGFYYRGLAYQSLAQEYAGQEDEIRHAFSSFFDFKTVVEKYPTQRNWVNKAEGRLDLVHPLLKKEGINLINKAYGPDLPTSRRQELTQAALPYFEALIYINPADFANYDMRGQIKLLQSDSTGALADFYKAQELYQVSPPDQPDLMLAYSYYRSALIQKTHFQDTRKALSDIQTGIKVLDRSFEQLQTYRNAFNDAAWAQQESRYQNAFADLKAFELDLYSKYPQNSSEGIEKFKKAIEEDPNNYSIRITYAGMLEPIDRAAAIEQYKKAITIDANQEIALFNLGALYVNAANQIFNQANDAEDLEEYARLSKLAKGQYKEALPFLEMAHQVNPENYQTLQAIMQIAMTLEDMEKFQKYKAIKQEMENKQ